MRVWIDAALLITLLVVRVPVPAADVLVVEFTETSRRLRTLLMLAGQGAHRNASHGLLRVVSLTNYCGYVSLEKKEMSCKWLR